VSAHDATPDHLTPFVFEGAAVRGAYVRLGATARDILAGQAYPPALRRVLAELLAAACLLSSTLKFSGSLIVQLSGDGPVRLLVVECSDALELRATAQWDAQRTMALTAQATLADLAGGPAHSRLAITLDPRGQGSIYQGIVALEATSIATLLEHYLATSEQLASRLVLAVAGPEVAGMLVQRLPGGATADDDAWRNVQLQLDDMTPEALLASPDPRAVLAGAFPHDDLRVFAARPAMFRCSCSRERVANALRIAGAAEIESILAERGEVEVTCEFCNHRYVFAPAEARDVFLRDANTPLH